MPIIGSGSDSILLNVTGDPDGPAGDWNRWPKFTVSVDGKQVGDLQTTTAVRASGQTETFDFRGNWGPGPHKITVTFANNSMTAGDKGWFGTGGDRNLIVTGLTYNGAQVFSGSRGLWESPLYPPESSDGTLHPGNAIWTVNDTTALPAGAGPNPTPTPGPIFVGSGPDLIILRVGEDDYQGHAQFTVSVDGTQIGGTLTTTAIQWMGQEQEVHIRGTFGGGTHQVGVRFLNDAGAVGPDGRTMDAFDRNVYVMGLTMNGGPEGTGAPFWIASNGTRTFSVTAGSSTSPTPTPTPTPTPPPTTVPPHTLSLVLSEDRYQGDAQFIARVDGQQIAGPTAVTALHSQGATQTFNYTGQWAVGQHDLEISFINDRYDGAGRDRNLYVDDVRLDGRDALPSAQPLYSNGSLHIPFSVT